MKVFKPLLAAIALLAASWSHAAFITLNEAGMDAVYSQVSFGGTPIDIRYGPQSTIVAPTLLDISTDAEVGEVFGLHVGPANVVNFYFIDTLSFCGGVSNASFIGCGERPGQDFVVESDWAARMTIFGSGSIAAGVGLLAHELAHNLGVVHRNGDFLMNPAINSFPDLNEAEVAVMLASPLVQLDANGQRFIQINPVLIVPAPSTLLLALVALAAAGVALRRARPQASL